MRDHIVACLLAAARPFHAVLRLTARPLRIFTVACVLVVLLGACGSAGKVQTLDHTTDFGSTAVPLAHASASGLGSVSVDGTRLIAACTAIGTRVAALVPDVDTEAVFTGRHCEWNAPAGSAVMVGMIEQSGASFTLDETKVYTDDERTIPRIGQRATYDPQTHALYVVIDNRLWYVQLVGGAASEPSALQNVSAIARALANTPAAQ